MDKKWLLRGLEVAKDILRLDYGPATFHPCCNHWYSNQLISLTLEAQSFSELSFIQQQAGADALWRKCNSHHLLWRESVLTVCSVSHRLVFLNLDEIPSHCTKNDNIDRFGFLSCCLFPSEDLHGDSVLAFANRCVVYVLKLWLKNGLFSPLSLLDIIITTFFTLKRWVLISSKMILFTVLTP